jgi:hypothetical protein
MITLDLSILNQKGTPMFYSDTLALRPTFGIAGRIFIATDSPYGIFRDTGSAWDQIAGSGGGGITGSGTVNTIPMFTPTSTAIGDSQITQTGANITITGRNLIVSNGSFTLSHSHAALTGTVNPYASQVAATNTFNAGITWTALLACFNSSSLQSNLYNGSVTFGNGSYTTNNLNLTSITFNAAGSTITSTQASGGIRAYANQILQLRIDGTNNGTYTHYANSAIYGDFASSTARFTITNRYGYLVNNLDEYSAGHTYTNRWAFYNAGINDNNFFAGKVGIGSGYVPSTFQLDVNGTARVSGDVVFGNATLGGTNGQGQITLGKIVMNYEGLFSFSSAYGLRIQGTSANSGTIQIDGSLIRMFTTSSAGIDFSVPSSKNLLIKKQQGGADTTSFLNISGADQTTSGQPGAGGVVRIYGGLNNGVQEQGLVLLAHNGTTTQGSVIVGGTSPSASALFQIDSTTKGFLPPRMTTVQKNAIDTPAQGLMVYDTTLNKVCVYTTAWETITSI